MKEQKVLIFTISIFFLSLALPAYAQPKLPYRFGQENPESSPGKISLEIKGMDIIDVLKILAMRGNLNIVAGKNVRGKVTMFLKDVDVLDALEIILAANGLAYEEKAGIINVMTERDYELLYGERKSDRKIVRTMRVQFSKATEIAKALNQIKSKIGKVVVDEGSNTLVLIDVPQKIEEMEEAVKNMDLPTVTRTFFLNYAKAKDLEEKIRESLSKNVGELKIDERTNKIVVTDLPEKIKYIEKMITDFDEKDKLVLIEAKIVQITLSEDVGYGVNWNNVFAGIDTIAAADLSMNLSGVSPTATFTYTRAHGATEYGDQVILRLLESVGKTDVLSSPRITVANNQEAKVLVGTKEVFVTSTVTQSDGVTTTADNVQFVDVGVSLSVVPTINEDGYITMKIRPEVSSAPTTLELTNADGSVRSSIPIVTTAEAETILSVKDGTTIIMAGLIEDTRKNNKEKIPLLGDLPLLGHFFQSRGREKAKTELVIFLTPHIIQEGEDDILEQERYLRQHERATLEELEGLDFWPLGEFEIEDETDEIESDEPEETGEMESSPGDLYEYGQYLRDSY